MTNKRGISSMLDQKSVKKKYPTFRDTFLKNSMNLATAIKNS
jgi:hypothetical protein